MANREKEGKTERKRTFRWNKKHFFTVFEGQSFGEKNKNSGHSL